MAKQKTRFDVKPAKPKKTGPGMGFEATVANLARKYKNLDEIFRRMTYGQLRNHFERDGCIIHYERGLIYNKNTGEIND